MRDFVSDTGTGGISHVVDADGALWQRFGVYGQPAFVDIGRDGTAEIHRGGRDLDELRRAADELVAG